MTITEKIEQIKSILANPELDEMEMLLRINRVVIHQESKKRLPIARYTLKQIGEQVVNYFEISIEEINKKSRDRAIIQARQFAHYKASRFTSNSDAVIGKYFGGKDHATVFYGTRTIAGYLQMDRQFAKLHGEFLNN